MKKGICVLFILIIYSFTANSQNLYREGVWGTYAWNNPWNDADFTKENDPHIKGAPIILRWSALEPEAGNYQFEKLIGEKLKHADKEDFYTMLSIWVGPMSPEWIYEKVVPRLDMARTKDLADWYVHDKLVLQEYTDLGGKDNSKYGSICKEK